MIPEILSNRQICEDLAARLAHGEKMIETIRKTLEQSDLPDEDRLRLEGMLKFWEDYVDAIKEQLAKWCK